MLGKFFGISRNYRTCMSKSSGFCTTDRDYYGFSPTELSKPGVFSLSVLTISPLSTQHQQFSLQRIYKSRTFRNGIVKSGEFFSLLPLTITRSLSPISPLY